MSGELTAELVEALELLRTCSSELTDAENNSNFAHWLILSLLDVVPAAKASELLRVMRHRLTGQMVHEIATEGTLQALAESNGWPLVRKLTLVKDANTPLMSVSKLDLSLIESLTLDGDPLSENDIADLQACIGGFPHLKSVHFSSGLSHLARSSLDAGNVFQYAQEIHPIWPSYLQSPYSQSLTGISCLFSEELFDSLHAHPLINKVNLRLRADEYPLSSVRNSLISNQAVSRKISSLTIEADSAISIVDVLVDAPLENLRRLSISGEGVEIRGLERIPVVRSLVDLDLNIRQLGNSGWSHLGNCPLDSLKRLCLAHTSGGDVGIESISRNETLSGLRHLDLTGNAIGPAGMRALVSSPVYQDLETLGLHGNPIGMQGIASIVNCPKSASLRKLSLSKVCDGGSQILESGSHTANLKELFLSFQPECGTHMSGVAKSASLQNLVRLTLGFSGSKLAESFFNSFHCCSLRRLKIVGNLGAEGTRALASKGFLEPVLELDLNYCSIGDEGARHLASESETTKIVSLGIAGGKMTISGSRLLADSGRFPYLRELSIESSLAGPLIVGAHAADSEVTIIECSRLNGRPGPLSNSHLVQCASTPFIALTILFNLYIVGLPSFGSPTSEAISSPRILASNKVTAESLCQ